MIRPLAIGILFCLSCPQIYSQAAVDAKMADIRLSRPNTMNQMRQRVIVGRYELRNASVVDLIKTAWNVQPDDVEGGPEWLDDKRFDVSIPVTGEPSPEQLRSSLQSVLSERFDLAVHKTTQKFPAFKITVADQALVAKALQPSASDTKESGCRQRDRASPAEPIVFECHDMSIAQLVETLPNMRASGYLFNDRVADFTGLNGSWDFTVKWTPRDSWRPGAARGGTISIFQAFQKQLGLRLALGGIDEPVIFVDRVNEPANLPGAKPADAAALQFEVAVIKPVGNTSDCSDVGIQPGGRVQIRMTLGGLIREAWGDVSPRGVYLGGPKGIEATCFQVLAKAPVEDGFGAGWVGPVWNGVDLDSMRMMLRNLLFERFHLKAHMDERTVPGYDLLRQSPSFARLYPPAARDAVLGSRTKAKTLDYQTPPQRHY